MSTNLFSNLKEDLESAKEEVMVSQTSLDISKILVITDGFDNVEWRFEVAENLAKRFDAELSKIYLYDLKGSLFTNSVDDDISAINAMRAHSEKIKELKEHGVQIIFDETVKNWLVETREIRRRSNEETPEITSDDFDILMDFFLDDADMEFNLIAEINRYVDEFKPNLVYWKPNLLEERKWQQELGLSDVDNLILQHIPNGSLVLLEGMKKVSQSRKVVTFIEGGEDDIELQVIISAMECYFEGRSDQITFISVIDENALNLASIVPDEEIDEKNIQEILKQKIGKHIEQLRIHDISPDQKIVFGEIETELEIVLRELNADLLVISPRRVGNEKFDTSALGAIEITIKEGVGILAII